jgi:protease-4
MNNDNSAESDKGSGGKKSPWRFVRGMFATLTALGNLVFLIIVIGIFAVIFTDRRNIFVEEVIREGPKADKIAVVGIRGIIDNRRYRLFSQQIKRARDDKTVKGIILRVNSPGGTISGSDEIYNEIKKYRQDTNEPVISFMQSKAASGAYYVSASCDKIVAEPTAITGSIGVVFSHLVVNDMLNDKLGIKPFIIKEGKRKDWPSPFREPSQEELDYIQGKFLEPAYNRFVEIVATGRSALELRQVKDLADGSIYTADEALEQNLIDSIGYLNEAIEEISVLTGIKELRVVEYRKRFSLSSLFQPGISREFAFDRKKLYEITAPQALYLWAGF